MYIKHQEYNVIFIGNNSNVGSCAEKMGVTLMSFLLHKFQQIGYVASVP